ncbi:MAG: prolipoprotein diacylglyceryl transferase [Mycobacteriales bacterium]|nr:prolipoprotein diacylglyceryl transferase [Frankia sp.]
MVLALTFSPVQRVLFFSPHGVMTAVGFVVGGQLLVRECRRRDFDADVMVSALTRAALGAIVGARVDYVLFHWSDFFGAGVTGSAIGSALRIWEGGLALYGGLIGGFAAGLPVLINARAHLPRILDATAPALALGVAIGRIGDLLIADHLGRIAPGWAHPIAFLIEPGYHLAPGFMPSPAVVGPCINNGEFYAGCHYYLAAGYDLVGAALLSALLLSLRRRGTARAGVAFATWGAWYGAQRFVIDFTRSTVDAQLPLGLTDTQVLGALLSITSLVVLVGIRRRRRGLLELPNDPPSRAASLVLPPPVPAPGLADPDGQASSADSASSSTPSENPRA